MIVLTLLHPLQSVAIQSWTFSDEPSIKIGRATNNEVVLYSAVVSRHHVEIRKSGEEWEIINLGSNGTYIDGVRVERAKALDGTIVRLASSGPKILIKIESDSNSNENDNLSDRAKTKRLLKGARDTLIS